jgi:hypothetical protein
MASKYSFELWSASGILLADLAGRARNRRLTKSRNEADVINWDVDFNEFESYCRLTNQDPRTLLVPGQTEIRVRRGGTYLSGGQLDYFNPQIDANQQTINVKASGFLNLWSDRYTADSRTFTATQATTIASTLITESQGQGPNWDYGITIGPMATVGPHDRSYSRTNIKDALQALTRVPTNPFDMEFTYNKVFKTYASMGSNRPDIQFEFPNNVISFSAPVDGTGIANRIYAYGQGFGDQAAAQFTADSIPSQATYKVREKVLTTNGVDNSDNGLTDAANSELAAWAFPFQIPPIVVDGNKAPFITDYGIGDYVKIKIGNYRLLRDINGLFRIEKFDLEVDDNDNERVTLYLSV